LLDGCDEFFVVPVEAHFFQYGGYWVDYALRRAWPQPLTNRQIVRRYVQHIEHTNKKSADASRTSDNVLSGRWDVNAFARTMYDALDVRVAENNHRALFDLYIEAIHVALYGVPPSKTRFIEKSVENAEFASLLKRLYPGARFVHVMRNPYATLVAIRKHMGRKKYPFLGPAISALRNSYYYLHINPQVIGDYLVVRFEDLVTHPETTMESVARFIDARFSESMLIPTADGRRWPGNSTSGERFSGISTKPLTAWTQAIQPLETTLINNSFDHVLQHFGYNCQDPSGSCYKPGPRERPAAYLANRWLWMLSRRSPKLV
jgi:hypothetical protein